MVAGQLLLVAAMVSAPEAAVTPQAEVTTVVGSPSLVLAPATAQRGVPVYRLEGTRYSGELVSVGSESVVLRQDGKPITIPTAEIMDIVLTIPDEERGADASRTRVDVTDGSVVHCSALTVEGRSAVIQSSSIGEMRVLRTQLRSIRFHEPGVLRAEWNGLKTRKSKSDLLVIQKESKFREGEKTIVRKSLDFMQGAVSRVGPQNIAFQIDGNEIPVKRERVFGIVYANDVPDAGSSSSVYTVAGDVIRSRGLKISGGRVTVETLAGGTIEPQLSSIRRVDFGGARVQYLSDLEPRDVKYTPFFDHVYKYRRDMNEDGQPLRIDGKVFERGLYIHSKAKIVYRLAGGYRRFQACMGIDQLVGRLGDVHVVISGDGKVLAEADVRGVDKPRVLDLDVKDVRDLEILVDFGRDLDISDHLDLGDAKLLR